MPSSSKPIALTALLLSGFAGLLYEVCWLRQASLVFGSTTHAVSTVLAVFFLGLAAGSYAFGRIAQRSSHPLRLFALLEFGVGGLALLTPWAFEIADALYGHAYRTLDAGVLLLVRAVLVAAVVLPASFLMGGALPLFCRHAVHDGSRIAAAAGGLYGINTLGAALGCAATGLWLLPAFGLHATYEIGAALNLAAALAVLALRSRPLAAVVIHESAPPPGVSRDRSLVASLFFLTGFVALGSEVLWTRFLGLIIDNHVTLYTLTLTAVLLGIVLGSLLAASLFDRIGSRGFLFGLIMVLTGLTILALMLLPPGVWRALGDRVVPTLALLLLPPAVLSGACMPLAVRLVVDDPDRASLGVGRLLALNTLGGIGGSLAAGFVGIPLLGLQTTLLVLTGSSVAGGIAAWAFLARGTPVGLRALAAVSTLGLWLALPGLLATRIPADFLTDEGDVLLDYREGQASNLAVIRYGGIVHLEIDRWWQGQRPKNHQAVAAHVPLLLHPDPRRVLVVGAGTGQTPGRVLLYPGVERLDCVDIEPAVFDVIADHFDAEWMHDERVSLVRGDGRDHLAHGATPYDVISLELGQIFRPGVASFYTADFYQRVRVRLAANGLVSQFVPLPFLTLDQFRGIVRTFLEVFPESLLWYNTSELLLIGVRGEFRVEPARLALLSTDEAIHRDLAYDHWGGPDNRLHDPVVFLGSLLTGPRGLWELARGGEVYRDDRPVLDHAISLTRLDPTATHEIPVVEALREHLQPAEEVLGIPRSETEAAAVRELRRRNLDDLVASALTRRAALTGNGDPKRTLPALRQALEYNPDRFETHLLLAEALLLARRTEEARTHFAAAVRLKKDEPRSRRGLGMALLQEGRIDEAVHHYHVALDLEPGNAEAQNNLGSALAERGDLIGALRRFEEALRLQPDFVGAQRNLDRARAQTGRDR